jgi:hypothetical protein
MPLAKTDPLILSHDPARRAQDRTDGAVAHAQARFHAF